MEQRQIVLKDQVVNYYHWKANQPSSKTVIFLHGWRSSARIWEPIIHKLGENEGYDIFAPDLSGFGSSEAPKRPFTLLDYAQILEAFIRKLNLRNVCLVGHSFGGRVAIKSVAVHRDLSNKLVLVDSAGFQVKTAKKSLFKIIAKFAKPVFRLPFLKGTRRKIYEKIGAEDYLATPELRQTFLNVINEDLSALLPLIRQKTLIFWGERDLETPLMFGLLFKENIKDSQLITFPNAGHFSFLDEPEKFTKNLKGFINT